MKLITQLFFLLGVFVNSKDPRYKMERANNQKSQVQTQMDKILNDNTLSIEKDPILNIVKKKTKQIRNKNQQTYSLRNLWGVQGDDEQSYPNQYLCGLIVYLQYPDKGNGLEHFGTKWCGFGNDEQKVIDENRYNLLRKELFCMKNSFIYKIDSQYSEDKGIYDVRVFCYNPVSEKETVESTYMNDESLTFKDPQIGLLLFLNKIQRGFIDQISAQYSDKKIIGIVDMKYRVVQPICKSINKVNVNDGRVCADQVFNCEKYEQAKCVSCQKGYILQKDKCVLKIFNCQDQHDETCYKCFNQFTLQNNVCYREVKNCNRQIEGVCIQCKNGLNLSKIFKQKKIINVKIQFLIVQYLEMVNAFNVNMVILEAYASKLFKIVFIKEIINVCNADKDIKSVYYVYLGEEKCTKKIKNCLENDQDHICLQCEEGFISGQFQIFKGGKNMISNCFKKIENCIEQIDYNCEQCDFNYILIDNECQTAPILAKELTRVEIEELIKAQQPAPPADDKKDQAPAVDKKDQAPAVDKKDQAPADDKKDETPAVDKKDETPADDKKDQAPADDKKDERKRLNKNSENKTK